MGAIYDMAGGPLMRPRLALHALKTRFSRDRFQKLPKPTHATTGAELACDPAFFDPDTLGRVIACGFNRSMESEVSKLWGTTFLETPIETFDLGPALIAGGQIYAASGVHRFSSVSPIAAARAPLQTFETMHLVNSLQGMDYFGHWLRDDCAVFEMLLDKGETPYSLTRTHMPDAAFYETAFGHAWTTVDYAHVENLRLYRDLGFSTQKKHHLDQLRAKLRAAHASGAQGEVVYISRGTQGSARNMSNAQAFEADLAAAGVRIVTPASDSTALARDLLDARIIITIEGSQAAHGVYHLADKGAMIILQPPTRFYNPHREWTRLMGVGYGIVIGTADDTSFTVDSSEVLRMIDRITRASA